MPPITRLFVKTSLVYFVAALLAGLAIALRPLVEMPAVVAGMTPVYFHLLMVGWVTQLIIGMAYWMFPRFSKEEPRGSYGLAVGTFVLLNAGLILRVIAEPAQTVSAMGVWGWLLALSALLQWLGGTAFIINTWTRVKER